MTHTDAVAYEDMPDSEYFALPSLDQSQLKQFLHSPYDWAWNRLHPHHETTDAMRFGTAFHAYLLGTGTVVALPEGETFRSKKNQQWKDEQLEQGNIVVSADELVMCRRMRENLEASSNLSITQGEETGTPGRDFIRMIEEGAREQAFEWTDRTSGLRLKGKADLIPQGVDYLVDVKTCQSVDPVPFAKACLNHGYHIQSEFYRMGVSQFDPQLFGRYRRRASGMEFWCFEKTDAARWQPYVIKSDSPAAELARKSIRQGLNTLSVMVADAQDAGYGEGYDAAAAMILDQDHPTETKPVEFTDWMLRDAMRIGF